MMRLCSNMAWLISASTIVYQICWCLFHLHKTSFQSSMMRSCSNSSICKCVPGQLVSFWFTHTHTHTHCLSHCLSTAGRMSASAIICQVSWCFLMYTHKQNHVSVTMRLSSNMAWQMSQSTIVYGFSWSCFDLYQKSCELPVMRSCSSRAYWMSASVVLYLVSWSHFDLYQKSSELPMMRFCSSRVYWMSASIVVYLVSFCVCITSADYHVGA